MAHKDDDLQVGLKPQDAITLEDNGTGYKLSDKTNLTQLQYLMVNSMD